MTPSDPSPRVPGLLLGAGLGGFVDGIVLHQVLQWHHMVSARPQSPTTTLAGLELNTLADGAFHLATLALTIAGVLLLARRGLSPGSAGELGGWVLAGWGAFNLVEGVINHHLLGVHHVREGAANGAYDVAYLLMGAALLLGGRSLARRARAGVGARPTRRG